MDMDMDIEDIDTEIYFKELAQMIADKCKISRAAWQAGNSVVLSLKSVGRPLGYKLRQDFYVTVLRQNSFFSGKSIFGLKAFNWLNEVPPTHPTLRIISLKSY